MNRIMKNKGNRADQIVYGIPIEEIKGLSYINFNADPKIMIKSNVRVNNKYVESKTKRELSVHEARFLLLTMSALQNQELTPFEAGCYAVKISKKAISEIVTDSYEKMLDTLGKLIDSIYVFEKLEREDRFHAFFISAVYYYDRDYVCLVINPLLNDLIINTKENYTIIKLQHTYKLRRYYSAKLYMMLRRFSDTGYRFDNLEDLKEKLGCKNKYPRFLDFERWVLKPSINEINIKTDISISYNKITEGKRITGIEFKIEPKDKQYEEWIENKFKSCCMKYIETNMSSIKNPAGFFSSIYGSDEKLYNFIKDAIELFKQKYEVQLRFDEGLQLLVKQSEIIFKHSPKLAFLYLFERSDRDMIAKIIRSKNIFS